MSDGSVKTVKVMFDPHHNIFYYYSDTQREDNLTKALINTLEYCGKRAIINFLRRILEDGGRKFKLKCDEVNFVLQPDVTAEVGDKKVKTKILLGISSNGELRKKSKNVKNLDEILENLNDEEKRKILSDLEKLIKKAEEKGSDTVQISDKGISPFFEEKSVTLDELWYVHDVIVKKGRPDAMIISDNFVIVIENKLKSELLENQLDRQNKSLTAPKENQVVISWRKNVYPVVVEMCGKESEIQKFLFGQFKKYLEVIGMSPFIEDDFKWSRDEDSFYNFCSKFEKLGDEIHSKLKEKYGKTNTFEKRSLGIVKENEDPGWYGFYLPWGSKKCEHIAHFSIFAEEPVFNDRVECHSICAKLHVVKDDLKNMTKMSEESFLEFLWDIVSNEDKRKRCDEYGYYATLANIINRGQLRKQQYVSWWGFERKIDLYYYAELFDEEWREPEQKEKKLREDLKSNVGLMVGGLKNKNKKMWFNLYAKISINRVIELDQQGKLADEIVEILDDWMPFYKKIVSFREL